MKVLPDKDRSGSVAPAEQYAAKGNLYCTTLNDTSLDGKWRTDDSRAVARDPDFV